MIPRSIADPAAPVAGGYAVKQLGLSTAVPRYTGLPVPAIVHHALGGMVVGMMMNNYGYIMNGVLGAVGGYF